MPPHASERGQGIVEFAVVFPIFALFIFVMIDGGLLMGRNNVVHHSAREGARVAATGADEDAIRDRVIDQSQGLLSDAAGCEAVADDDADMICVQWLDVFDDAAGDLREAGQVGSAIRVRVRYKYDLLTPLPPPLDQGFTVESCALTRLERPNLGVPASLTAPPGEC
ncbi:MAG TPA: TadE family protein [Dehalococcoidia bacterium]|nr:TadE family protein [Dehalococcoidia bacterium]